MKNRDEKPVTHVEFQEGMQMIAGAFEKVLTKEDAKQFVTKTDLKKTLKNYPTKQDLDITIKKALEPYATKKDLKNLELGIKHVINDAVGEILHETGKIIKRHKVKQDARITKLERHVYCI